MSEAAGTEDTECLVGLVNKVVPGPYNPELDQANYYGLVPEEVPIEVIEPGHPDYRKDVVYQDPDNGDGMHTKPLDLKALLLEETDSASEQGSLDLARDEVSTDIKDLLENDSDVNSDPLDAWFRKEGDPGNFLAPLPVSEMGPVYVPEVEPKEGLIGKITNFFRNKYHAFLGKKWNKYADKAEFEEVLALGEENIRLEEKARLEEIRANSSGNIETSPSQASSIEVNDDWFYANTKPEDQAAA